MVKKVTQIVTIVLNAVFFISLVGLTIRGNFIVEAFKYGDHPFWKIIMMGIFMSCIFMAPLLNMLAVSGILKGAWGTVSALVAAFATGFLLLFWTFGLLWPLGHLGDSVQTVWFYIVYGILIFSEFAIMARIIDVLEGTASWRKRSKSR